ncbi:MAG: hypothetical protein B7Z82_05970 [Halothiobacillus sp. 20-54-6]|nr:MAG: hypothetical protein B7Z82_05970 [Halothiobacillus sp. 20-54-6]
MSRFEGTSINPLKRFFGLSVRMSSVSTPPFLSFRLALIALIERIDVRPDPSIRYAGAGA